MKAILHFNLERCKGCGLCIDACPKAVLTLDKYTPNSQGYAPVTAENEQACTACASCAKICPDSVISISVE